MLYLIVAILHVLFCADLHSDNHRVGRHLSPPGAVKTQNNALAEPRPCARNRAGNGPDGYNRCAGWFLWRRAAGDQSAKSRSMSCARPLFLPRWCARKRATAAAEWTQVGVRTLVMVVRCGRRVFGKPAADVRAAAAPADFLCHAVLTNGRCLRPPDSCARPRMRSRIFPGLADLERSCARRTPGSPAPGFLDFARQ
jgi:hypothetical protein